MMKDSPAIIASRLAVYLGATMLVAEVLLHDVIGVSYDIYERCYSFPFARSPARMPALFMLLWGGYILYHLKKEAKERQLNVLRGEPEGVQGVKPPQKDAD